MTFGMSLGRGLTLLVLTGALASCGVVSNIGGRLGGGGARGSNQIEINDTVFRSKLGIGGPDKRDLTITVRPVAVDPNSAQEAGRYRATVYCLRKFGSSETEWTVGPDIPPEDVQIDADDSTTLIGRCSAR